MPVTDNLFKIAAAGLFVALGAVDDEMEPAIEILRRHSVPGTVGETAQAARDALALVRLEAGRAP